MMMFVGRRETRTPSAKKFLPQGERRVLPACKHARKLMPPMPSSEQLIGKTIDNRYQIKKLIGEGGMGAVYQAHESKLGRDVAVKVMHTRVQDASYEKRFLREARTMAQLAHPYIVPIYDQGVAQVGDAKLSYIVMRLLSGGSLNDLIYRDEKIGFALPTLHEVTRVVTRLAEALDYAHNKGIVHRDIKPQNILFDEQGNIYLADFGIAKLINEQNSQITNVDSLVGTPHYMAPELWQGLEVRASADQYAVGVLVFLLLTGDFPFSGEVYQLRRGHIQIPVPQMQTLRPELNSALQPILEKVLAKTSDARYPTVTDFARALQHVADSERHHPDKSESGFFDIRAITANVVKSGPLHEIPSQTSQRIKRANARIILNQSPNKISGQEWRITNTPFYLGRDADGKPAVVDISFDKDPHVSPEHAVITYDSHEQAYRIEDLSSKFGTYVNGERLKQPYTLKAGTSVSLRLGTSTELRFLVMAEATTQGGVKPSGAIKESDTTRIDKTDVVEMPQTSSVPEITIPKRPFTVPVGKLYVLRADPPPQTETWHITKTVFTIGRSKEADATLPGCTTVSRLHCKLIVKDNQYYIEDLNSANGTLVDHTELQPHQPYLLQPNKEHLIVLGRQRRVVIGFIYKV